MKKFILLLSIVLFGCESKSTEVAAPPKAQNDVLTGLYSMTKYGSGFASLETFNPNDLIWQFNAGGSLTVTINTPLASDSRVPIKVDSTVNYSLVNNNVIIQGTTYSISIQNNKLVLDSNSAADGPRIEFDKIVI